MYQQTIFKKHNFDNNFSWQKEHAKQVMSLIKQNAGLLIDINTAIKDKDMKEATDFVINVSGGDIAVRLRKSGYPQRDLTIRHGPIIHGYEPETWKIANGFGRWYFYGWMDKNDIISEYVIVDLDIVRRNKLINPYGGYDYKNKDGTGFIVIPLYKLEKCGALLTNTVKQQRPQLSGKDIFKPLIKMPS